MPIAGMPEDQRLKIVSSSLEKMEALARQLRDGIAAQPPHDLLGYIYAQQMLSAIRGPESGERAEPSEELGDQIDDTQFLLEYVHAVLASTPVKELRSFDEATSASLLDLARKLKTTALFHAMATSAGTDDGTFGPNTAEIEFQAKSTWVLLRGNRHQVLEHEFYSFVLAPHDAVLRDIYGLGAEEIAIGFQDMADAVRTGQSDAFSEMAKQFDAAQAAAAALGKPFEDIASDWAKDHAKEMKAAALAVDDLFRGGICNVSRHSRLPPTLLADLAYQRGEEAEFFQEGEYSGTPFRTLPARKKPLINLDGEHYAVDPCFIRDSGYRALLWNLLRRRPEYRKTFESRQKSMSESAFFEIFSDQLKDATIYQEVYYKDTETNQWVENDTLILIDDTLILVEAKSGAAATIASPALDFARHAQAVQDLVVKAYNQCRRFFGYLNSAGEVPIFRRTDKEYVECGRLQQSTFRLLLPIGLTVESFSPFSTMCKELPEMTPLLGRHPFVSLSIDELLVLTRFLPTMGEIAHYFEVRQALAGMKGVLLFDEFDHLGAYIKKNRFDQEILEQREMHNPDLMVWDGMSEPVDQYFAQGDWQSQPIPMQDYPPEMLELLKALNDTRAPGWLSAESHIRNYGDKARLGLARALEDCRKTLDRHPSRYFSYIGDESLFVWLQRIGVPIEESAMRDKASAAALTAKTGRMMAIVVIAEPEGRYVSAERFTFEVPSQLTSANAHIYEDAERMTSRQVPTGRDQQGQKRQKLARPLGRNERCWCGSGLIFKKCHGR